MGETVDDLRRRLHEALDSLARRDELVARLRDDLEASGRRLSEEAARRRAAELRAADAEHRLATGDRSLAGMGDRAAVRALVARAGTDLAHAGRLGARAAWRRLPEPVRAGAWRVRRRVRPA